MTFPLPPGYGVLPMLNLCLFCDEQRRVVGAFRRDTREARLLVWRWYIGW